jgi:23S rRNA (uridine2552-2'-O)-methyltransferase
MSGMTAVDQPRAMHLCELTREFADQHLKTGGNLLLKMFHGQGFDAFIQDLRLRFTKVQIRKPKASRNRSPEVYALATGKRAGGNEAKS